MLIFLDFDGVLHPQNPFEPLGDLAFCHLPRFENVVRDYPNIEIVISSTWRENRTLDQLKSLFSEDIAPRIIGTTPITPSVGCFQPSRREGEILDWLVDAKREVEPWIALDDAAWQFTPPREHLLVCQTHIGFDEICEKRLRQMLDDLS